MMVKRILGFALYTCAGSILPHGSYKQFPVAQAVRRASAKLLFDSCGKKINLGRRCRLSTHISMGDNSSLGDWSYVSGTLHIGNNVMIAPRCAFLGLNHVFDEDTLNNIGSKREPITIKDRAWLGYGVTVLPGVTIGEYAIVGAQSVVTHDVAPYSVVAGSPAKQIKMRR